jgi:hypothetical protein
MRKESDGQGQEYKGQRKEDKGQGQKDGKRNTPFLATVGEVGLVAHQNKGNVRVLLHS